MTVAPRGGGGAVAAPGGGSGNLYDVLELVLDRGLVIDAFVRVSLVGIEIAKIDARIVVASVDTYLRFADAANRLDLESGRKAPAQLTDVVGEAAQVGSKGKTKGALAGAVEAVTDSLQGRRDKAKEEDEEAKEPAKARKSTSEHHTSRHREREEE
ncbi:gas vesicle protein GvpJ [Streptomyces sp. NPDC001530]|uniref:gas vesicle protein GvpJ n=1 Tax=Streptomyces sp. NPDC001530 TaxID=3364582 RepID=UPI003673D649